MTSKQLAVDALEQLTRNHKISHPELLLNSIEKGCRETDLSAELTAKLLDHTFRSRQHVANMLGKYYPTAIEPTLELLNPGKEPGVFTELVEQMAVYSPTQAVHWAIRGIDAIADTTDHEAFDSLSIIISEFGDLTTVSRLSDLQLRTGSAFYGNLAAVILKRLLEAP